VRGELADDLIKHLDYFGTWRFSSSNEILLEKEPVVRPSPIDPDLASRWCGARRRRCRICSIATGSAA
jgi:hypothetical protein